MVPLNLVYTFSMEFIMFACLIRLFRVVLLYKIPENRTGFWKVMVKIFKHQGKLFVLCCIWPLFVVGVDLWMKLTLN